MDITQIIIIAVAVAAVLVVGFAALNKKKKASSTEESSTAPEETEASAAPIASPAAESEPVAAAPQKKAQPVEMAEDEDDLDWGGDIQLDEEAEAIEEDDQGKLGKEEAEEERLLEGILPEIRRAFDEVTYSSDFHASKRKEADEFSHRCVAHFLETHETEGAEANRERIFALHPKIQLTDLPEFVESYVDPGEEKYYHHFAAFEKDVEEHTESPLLLFERFNQRLPDELRSERVGQVLKPVPAVIYLAPEWDQEEFDQPDFTEDDEEISGDEDFYEDFYDELDEDDDKR